MGWNETESLTVVLSEQAQERIMCFGEVRVVPALLAAALAVHPALSADSVVNAPCIEGNAISAAC